MKPTYESYEKDNLGETYFFVSWDGFLGILTVEVKAKPDKLLWLLETT